MPTLVICRRCDLPLRTPPAAAPATLETRCGKKAKTRLCYEGCALRSCVARQAPFPSAVVCRQLRRVLRGPPFCFRGAYHRTTPVRRENAPPLHPRSGRSLTTANRRLFQTYQRDMAGAWRRFRRCAARPAKAAEGASLSKALRKRFSCHRAGPLPYVVRPSAPDRGTLETWPRG
jgi:hypothetical protein